MAVASAEDNTVFTVSIHERQLVVKNYPCLPKPQTCEHVMSTDDDLVVRGLLERASISPGGHRYLCTRCIEGPTHIFGALLTHVCQFVSSDDVGRAAGTFEQPIDCILSHSAIDGSVIVPIDVLPHITVSTQFTRALQLLFIRIANYAMVNLALPNRIRLCLFRELMAQHAAHVGDQLAAVEGRFEERCAGIEARAALTAAALEARAAEVEKQVNAILYSNAQLRAQNRELSLRIAALSTQMAVMQRERYSHSAPDPAVQRLVQCIGQRFDATREIDAEMAERVRALHEVERITGQLPAILVAHRKRPAEAPAEAPPAKRACHG